MPPWLGTGSGVFDCTRLLWRAFGFKMKAAVRRHRSLPLVSSGGFLFKDFLDAVHQFLRAEGFCQVIIHLGNMQSENAVDVLSLCSYHDDGNVAGGFIGLHLLVYFPPVHYGHHQIEQHQIRMNLPDLTNSLHASGCSLHIVTTTTKYQPHQIDHFRFVFDAEDGFFAHAAPKIEIKCTIKEGVNLIKIITWNVNGIRALLRKGLLRWAFEQQPDLLCLQEIKARPEQLNPALSKELNLPYAWNPAQRPGYSGVVTFYLNEPRDIVMGMGDPRYDVEGRIVQTIQRGFRLLNVYFPSGSSGRTRVDYKLAFYGQLLDVCDALHKRGEHLVIAGEVNTAHQPIDLKYPKQNRNTSGFLPEEREWIQRYLEHGFVDAFRHLHPEKAQYTWWTNRVNARERGIGWRLDYFLVSSRLFPHVRDVVIHDEVPGSDHCPVEMLLDTLD